MLSIFSCVFWQSTYLLWRNVYLGRLPIFGLGCLFLWYWAAWAACIFWRLILWRGCGENGTLLHWWWECKLIQPIWMFLKKLKLELPYDPAIPLLGIYPEKTIIQKDTCTPMFIAALFTITRSWKQPKCHRWMDKEDVVHKYNGILFSHIKEWNWVICRDVDGPRNCHTECSKSEREKQIPLLTHICGI